MMDSLPGTLVRAICQALSHADIEQCRLVCKEWRGSFGAASVTDLYMVRAAEPPCNQKWPLDIY